MRVLNTTEWSTPNGHAVVDVQEDTDLVTFERDRSIRVKVDAYFDADEARRLIAELQHAVAVVEEAGRG